MGLAGPTLIAVDQIDSIVSASNILVGDGSTPVDDGEKKARHIIETLAGGLMDLHDLKRRAMTVVSCLEVTWPIIEKTAVRSAAQRFERIPVLSPIRRRETIEALIRGRLESAYGEAGLRDGRADNGSDKLDEDYLGRLYQVVRATPQDYGWRRPTWTRELLVETLIRRTGVRVHVTTLSRALVLIHARRGRPRPTACCLLLGKS